MKHDRREHDKKFDYFEKLILDLNATVNNGLTDRSKKNEKMVESIHNEHLEMRADLKAHVKQEGQNNAKVIETIENFTKAKNRVTIAVIIGLGSIISYIVVHSGQIANVMEHIATIAGQ